MNILKEYQKIKKLSKALEGRLTRETIQNFLDKLDEQTLSELQVKDEDIKRLKKASSETKLQILVPYFEALLQKKLQGKIQEKIQLAEELCQKIANKAIPDTGKIFIPAQELKMMAQLLPNAFIVLEYGKTEFIYPLVKFKQILTELDRAEISWEIGKNIVRIVSVEKRNRFYFILLPQEQWVLNGKLKFKVKIPAPKPSITELILKTAESILEL